MREETGAGSCPECGTPGAFAGQLVCQGCFVPFALMPSAHAAATPPPSSTAPTERLPRPGVSRPPAPGPDTPGAGPAPSTPPRAASDAEHTRVINVIPGVLPRPARTRRDAPVDALRLRFPGGDIVEVAPGYSIRLGRDPQLCPAVTFLAERDNLSRIHARVGVDTDGSAWITDEDSTNGTYVRGYRLAANDRTPLRPGDTFRLAADLHVSVLL
ncbi:FHA domain-containing protein [Actinacidiphila paucisporea]|uniref:FHA domain-containing protein n=1 Tax=Actinacidiphila paucisporea TaxID=310782 RepID=A0A1M7Q5U4_9ACTN|nr:FHA domain-containing protein [Actinacidiphila paucisporea]SHN25609.1 FHA domain-containing protein [Actinacidiphila paucisporea]